MENKVADVHRDAMWRERLEQRKRQFMSSLEQRISSDDVHDGIRCWCTLTTVSVCYRKGTKTTV